jgi:hypothetical protein
LPGLCCSSIIDNQKRIHSVKAAPRCNSGGALISSAGTAAVMQHLPKYKVYPIEIITDVLSLQYLALFRKMNLEIERRYNPES